MLYLPAQKAIKTEKEKMFRTIIQPCNVSQKPPEHSFRKNIANGNKRHKREFVLFFFAKGKQNKTEYSQNGGGRKNCHCFEKSNAIPQHGSDLCVAKTQAFCNKRNRAQQCQKEKAAEQFFRNS